jgi:hypothetical protein
MEDSKVKKIIICALATLVFSFVSHVPFANANAPGDTPDMGTQENKMICETPEGPCRIQYDVDL